MLHGTINEYGNCLNVRDGISEKNTVFHADPGADSIPNLTYKANTFINKK